VKAYFLKMFSDDSSVSLMRVLTAFVALDVMVTWTVACIYTWKIQDIPWGVVSIFTAMVVGKAAQRFAEPRKKDD